jgi:minor curlin subunit
MPLHGILCPVCYLPGSKGDDNMTIRTIALAALLTSTFGQAGAAESFSPAYIRQIDSGSFSRATTIDIVGPAVAAARSLSSLRPRNGNLGLIWQDGDLNTANISQTGVGNVGLIRQIGMENTASITQSGNGHQALVIQQGRGNQAFIRQR